MARAQRGGKLWKKAETLTGQQYGAVDDDAKFSAVTRQLRSMKWDFKLSSQEEQKMVKTGQVDPKAIERIQRAIEAINKAVANGKSLVTLLRDQAGAQQQESKRLLVLALKSATDWKVVLEDIAAYGETKSGEPISTAYILDQLKCAADSLEHLFEAVVASKSFVSWNHVPNADIGLG